MSNEIECSACGGTGKVFVEIDPTKIMYGEHEIGKDWTKIENAWIWFQAFNKPTSWRGIQGYVYETKVGEYIAPFRGELIKVFRDTRDEFREGYSNQPPKKRGSKSSKQTPNKPSEDK